MGHDAAELVKSLTKTVEDLTTKLATTEAKISEYEAERERKRAKKESLTLKDVLLNLGLSVPTEHMKRFGSDVKKQFDALYPERASRTFLKQGAMAFRSEDRLIVESLVLKEHVKFELRTLEVGPVKANEGLSEKDLEEICSSGDVGEPAWNKTVLLPPPQPPVQANVGVDLAELLSEI